MDMTVEVATLAAFAGGFTAIGISVGLGIYHLAHGWFISVTSREHLDGAVKDAERHLLRRRERKHARARRDRVLAEAGAGVPDGGRHLPR